MSGTEVQAADYSVPGGKLGLKGPVEKPAPGTLPLRGDLAHIALASTHLAAHYVIPHVGHVGENGAELRLAQRDDSEVTHYIEPGTRVEILDVAGDWVWLCLGPEGPSGYCKADCLAG
ncbi:SH3 domain-containing protein [Erythrobacter sp. THAF29]|uniref:SH3 domain-containing protein n=1 Tax=Erythrobacter sp. THAF29 TaxID=2587851 RepID=UPI0012691BD4|nr:SH3 domain-containing protein [Erythrobacter sp. THAF29]QFT77046.1 hypothetical protein FIU90_05785 [Erythrobacter sp. THAF29]